MGHWQDEEEIKAELRVLTRQLKELREELQNLVTPPRSNPSRAFLHRKDWPSETPDEAETADDRSRISKDEPKRR
ncbi:MAG: hypothetical protein ACRD1V_04150 [Vicinamibacterales bacterium]